MTRAMCKESVKVAWSRVLHSHVYGAALRLLDQFVRLERKQFQYCRSAKLSSARAVDIKDENRGTDKLENQIEDDAYARETFNGDASSHYPFNLADVDRRRNWRTAFSPFKKRAAEIKHVSANQGRSICQDVDLKSIKIAGENESVSTEASRKGGVTGSGTAERSSEPSYTNKSALTAEQQSLRNKSIASCIESYLRERLNPKCSVGVFGSAINGLWTDASDLDICVQIPNVTSRSAIIRNLRRIAFLLQPLAPGRAFENRFTAKIPILHWKNEKPNKRIGDPLIQSLGSSIDISVNNVLAISNSALLGTYVACDSRVKDLVLALKKWARCRDLNDRSKGTLGSFALSLMAIHFLQRCNPPVLVSLQDLAIADNESPKYVSGIDVRFTTNMRRIKEELNWASKGVPNGMTVAELLQAFFYYFGWTYTKNTQLPICIRSVDFQYMDTPLSFAHKSAGIDLDEKFMHVDNPFEVGVDVANISFHQRIRIVTELRRAYQILRAGGSYDDILAG
ncbi:-Poly(A) RNA polymerase GLD2 [Babesia bigemina]|uniref:-Poly(A) RNA polymerase GLD2 n=1 Tax=Babesia bigemina TaxID=5866 RepID=A0A061DC80_BABBI|nr:-Poly(A) RNA polymerase GLD2 [Babesia bigemina]CDR97647.1 -Poly(A) RNA polymerase GLD2 [Babesia bigemina]|eukprot:XP_012769833.1 -Poly(A) RNA polymerase GLD2 [Babesia bigemina]